MRYYRALLAGCIALFFCLQPQNSETNRAGADSGKEPSGAPVVKLLWKHAISYPLSMANSPDGKYIGVVTKGGNLQCFAGDGTLAWKAHIPEVDHLAVGSDGAAVAYAYLNPAETKVHLIAPDGQVVWRHEVDGAVWAAAASPESERFAVGTGELYCYVYTFTEKKQRYKRWRLPGVPCSAQFASDGESLVFGTWQDAGVCRYSIDGERLAWSGGPSERLHSAELCRSGGNVLVLAKPNTNTPEATVKLANRELGELWSKDLPFYNVTADVDGDGSYVAVGYQRIIAHKTEEMRENRIALYGRRGETLWEKGGVFGKWKLLELTASGRLLLCDDSSFYVLGRTGKIELKHKLPGSVRTFLRGPQRDKVAVYFSDGQLCVFSVE